ncbi:hypothetical protein WKH15_21560 [Pantoea agglomerans]|uniref:hypothetical protein n=1 Tax=Enterobacter agglomerans TaxID=549 RepID=UPI003C797EAB
MTDFNTELQHLTFEQPELKTTFKEAVQKLIEDIENNVCMTLALRDASRALSVIQQNQVTSCIHSRDGGETLYQLRLLLSSITETLVVAQFENGEEHRLIYPEEISISVLREYKRKGVKAWIELV